MVGSTPLTFHTVSATSFTNARAVLASRAMMETCRPRMCFVSESALEAYLERGRVGIIVAGPSARG